MNKIIFACKNYHKFSAEMRMRFDHRNTTR
jgi:hypothetical protein